MLRPSRALVLAPLVAACGLGVAGTGGGSAAPPGGPAFAGDAGAADAQEEPGPAIPYEAGAYGARVTSGLVALYEIEEGGGATVHDTLGQGPTLTVAKTTDVNWSEHAILVTDFTSIDSGDTKFDAIVAACKKSELSIETWVVPANSTEDDYGRIVTMASSEDRAFALGSFHDDDYHHWASMETSEDLMPTLAPQKVLTHLVETRAADGTLTLYVNGVPAGTRATDASDFPLASYPLYFANTGGGGRGWKGEIHLVAFYDHALSPAEVSANFAAGADP